MFSSSSASSIGSGVPTSGGFSGTAIVTGGGGFLGSHLVAACLQNGFSHVVAVDNFCTGQKANFVDLRSRFCEEQLSLVTADVCDPWTWMNSVPESLRNAVTRVFHFASPASPPHYQRLSLETLKVNSLGLERALEVADLTGAKVIFASTSEVYGDPEVHPQPETYWGRVNSIGVRSCYDEAKRFGEALIVAHNGRRNSQHGMVRIFNTYGPNMNPEDGRVIINFLQQAQMGRPLSLYGDGLQTRSFCYVEDLIRGILSYANHPLLAEPINLGNDKEYTLLELADVVWSLFPQAPRTFQRHPLPSDDPKQRRPDLTLAKKKLQWEPQIDLRNGLQRMQQSLLK